jgi:hypothetical protein
MLARFISSGSKDNIDMSKAAGIQWCNTAGYSSGTLTAAFSDCAFSDCVRLCVILTGSILLPLVIRQFF